MKAEELIDQYLTSDTPDATEALTKGMNNAYSRQENVKKCPECGLSVPPYPGKYPDSCPECGAELECVGKKKK